MDKRENNLDSSDVDFDENEIVVSDGDWPTPATRYINMNHAGFGPNREYEYNFTIFAAENVPSIIIDRQSYVVNHIHGSRAKFVETDALKTLGGETVVEGKKWRGDVIPKDKLDLATLIQAVNSLKSELDAAKASLTAAINAAKTSLSSDINAAKGEIQNLKTEWYGS